MLKYLLGQLDGTGLMEMQYFIRAPLANHTGSDTYTRPSLLMTEASSAVRQTFSIKLHRPVKIQSEGFPGEFGDISGSVNLSKISSA